MGTLKEDYFSRHKQTYLCAVSSLGLVCLISIIIDLHDQSHIAYDSNRNVQWLQLFDSDATSKPIGSAEWAFSYNETIDILGHVKVSPQKTLLIGSEVLDVLKRASSQLPKNMTQDDFNRLSHVIKKSFPYAYGKSLADLFNRYYVYEKESSALLVDINSANGDKKRMLLKAYTKKNQERQTLLFGKKNAEQLFSKQNKTQHYLNERRQIGVSKELTDDEKKERLDLLLKKYKESLIE